MRHQSDSLPLRSDISSQVTDASRRQSDSCLRISPGNQPSVSPTLSEAADAASTVISTSSLPAHAVQSFTSSQAAQPVDGRTLSLPSPPVEAPTYDLSSQPQRSPSRSLPATTPSITGDREYRSLPAVFPSDASNQQFQHNRHDVTAPRHDVTAARHDVTAPIDNIDAEFW